MIATLQKDNSLEASGISIGVHLDLQHKLSNIYGVKFYDHDLGILRLERAT